MRIILCLALLVMALSGCEDTTSSGLTNCYGARAGELSLLGNWDSDLTTSVLSFGSNCIGVENTCEMTFSFTRPVDGNLTINVTQTNAGAGCLSMGQHSCRVWNSTTHLQLNCGGATLSYSK
jgi:hypothetical protein